MLRSVFLILFALPPLASGQLTLDFEGKQLAADGAAADQFGHGVAVSGDTMVIGAQGANGVAFDSGAAYVFTRSGTTWTQQQKLFASDGSIDDTYGVHCDIDGDTIVVGSRFDDDLGTNAGAAYVYRQMGAVWVQEAKLLASDGAAEDALGRRVSIDGDTIVVGANGDDDNGASSGAAYVFTRSGTLWTEQAKLTASDGSTNDRFGIDVAVAGDLCVVGAITGDGSALNSGTAYVFQRSGSVWTQTSEVWGSDAATGDNFSRNLAFDGTTILVGAQSKNSGRGAAYAFVFNGLFWSEQQKLVAPDAMPADNFGASLAVEGDLCAVGAQQGGVSSSNSGSVYVYSRSAGIWSQEGELAGTAVNGDSFGFASNLDGGTLAIGAIGDDANGSGAGATYVYRVTQSGLLSASFSDVTAIKGLSGYDASAGDSHAPGAVFEDLTLDGYPELYLMRDGVNELYANVDDGFGGRTFQQVVNNGDAGNSLRGQGAIAADYDNDGDLDLYVLNWRASNVLYRNMWVEDHPGGAAGLPTELRFVDVTASTDPTPGTADDQHGVGFATYDNTALGLGNDVLNNSLTACWADVNRDGFVDLFHGSHDGLAGNPATAIDGQLGERDTLWLNQGDGTFLDVTMGPPWSVPAWDAVTGFEDAAGNCCDTNLANPQTPREFSCTNAASFGDYDNDGWPDLFVTNKSGFTIERDMFYRNKGLLPDGNWAGFELVTYSLPAGNGGSAPFGVGTDTDMGVIAGDIDNDGDLDAYVSLGTIWPTFCDSGDVDGKNALWRNQLVESGGTLSFDLDQDSIEAVWSWGVNLVDFDNNGWLDAQAASEYDARDFLYLNLDGSSFVEVAKTAGIDQCADMPRSFGSPAADYDGDGWMDLFVVNVDSVSAGASVPSALFENTSDLDNPDAHWLQIRLIGNPDYAVGRMRSTRDALGARIYVRADLDDSGALDANERMMREVLSGTGNSATTSTLTQHFGLGLATVADVRVVWPSGQESHATLAADQRIVLRERDLQGPAHDLSPTMSPSSQGTASSQ